MNPIVAITVLTGPHRNRRFCFQDRVRCTVGRAVDCLVQLSGDERDLAISRHHCRLDIDPPCVRLRDLGSMNGTYLNGRKVEPTGYIREDLSTIPVQPGDILTLGGTSLRIELLDDAAESAEGNSNA